jgi:hypothetical protein
MVIRVLPGWSAVTEASRPSYRRGYIEQYGIHTPMGIVNLGNRIPPRVLDIPIGVYAKMAQPELGEKEDDDDPAAVLP